MAPAKAPSSAQPRGSWPPTQVRLHPSVERDDEEIETLDLDLDFAKMDQDPFTYFLTPAPYSLDDDYDDGVMDFEMDLDAGIEDATHPPRVVRSVSPSNLDGLARPPPRPPTPPKSPATPELEHDLAATPEDLDEYMAAAAAIRAKGLPFGLPLRLKDLAAGKLKSGSGSVTSPMGEVDMQVASGRGRAAVRLSSGSSGTSRRKNRGVTAPGRLSPHPHAWREPSPDVWSIEEEPEEEGQSEQSLGMGDDSLGRGETGVVGRARVVDIPGAKKGAKRVRFVLPRREGSGGY